MTILLNREKPEQLSESLRGALRLAPAEGGAQAISAALDHQHPADIAQALRSLALSEALAVFSWLPTPQAAEVLDELDSGLTRYLIENLPPARIAALLDRLPPDDAAEVVSEASPKSSDRLLVDIDTHAPVEAEAIRDLLSYAEGTAGRIMSTRFAAFPPEATSDEVIGSFRIHAAQLDAVSNVYAVDPAGVLLGVASVRDVLAAPAGVRLAEFMTRAIAAVIPVTPQAEVARLIARYDLSALPVLDDWGRILGVVTVDDAIDVLMEELNDDYFAMVGSDADEMERRSPAQIARLRIPWLFGTMAIELLAGVVIARFDEVLTRVILLASFMPVISAISGNVGLQAAAIVVRGLDTGHVSLSRWGRQVMRELSSAFLMAIACGATLGVVGAVWSGHLLFGVIIGCALMASMLTAGIMGTLIPMVSKKLGFDPATTAGPFETAFQDVVGFAVFLWLASLVEPWLT